jgi:hypothetical protein
MIQLERFNLTTPELKAGTVDEAKTYLPGQFPENHFFHTDAGGFWVEAETRAAGTTANSSRARSELREVNPDGSQVNFHVLDVQDNILKATLTVTRSPVQKGRTTIGQVHVKDNTRPMLKLLHDGKTGSVLVSYRQVFNQPDPVNTTIVANTPNGQQFSYKIHVKNTNELVVTVTVNGVDTVQVLPIDPSWNARLLYLKAGTYIQEDAIASTLDTEGSTIYFEQLEVFHGVYVEPVIEPEVPEEPPVPVPTPYEALTTKLKDLEDEYYVRLKALQTEMKTELNAMTTEMKTLPDKPLLAPIYTEITDFKSRMTAGMNKPVTPPVA